MTTPQSNSAQPVAGASQAPPYRLALDPDGRSWTARENLVDILERELLGPTNGPDEILEGVPDSAYLVGRIAPVRLTAGRDDLGEAGSDDAASDVGDAVDADESRGVPLTAVDDSSASSEEDDVEDQPQKRGLMIPASMGLRCQVPDDLDEITVTASWGTYEPVQEKRGEGTEAAGIPDDVPALPFRRFQRTPHSIPKTIKIADLKQSRTTEIPLKDKVVLRVDRYDDVERGCRLIELVLCNDRETPRKIPVEAWLYQTKVSVSAGGAEVFLPVNDVLLDTREEQEDELRRLRLQYRNRLEFAHGRTCSVDWKVAEGARRASEVWTTWLPVSETPQTAAEEIGAALLDMRKLQGASADELRTGLEPIIAGYVAWLDGEEQRAEALPEHLRAEGLEAVGDARRVQQQLADGLTFLLGDEEALRCFRFMNRVMADQRVQSQVAERRASAPEESIEAAREAILAEKGARAHSWRTFQLAFVLMQLPLLSDAAAEKRSGDLAKAQLLFFPTGGGKTEAYLGLAAYTFAIRRRQGVVDAFDGPLDGRSGVAVLMRYTLRLLTAQQFQRATTLVCAAEMARRDDVATWGEEPFRIGLWVGTDVSPKRYDEAAEQLQKAHGGRGYRLTVLQIQRCPWCGTRVEARDVRTEPALRRVYVYCGDELAECPFADGGEVPDGLPVLTVDEEIYRLAPAFVIATVDKFARMAREGEAASLFGHVSRRCDRHGFVHPDYQQCDIKEGSKHPKKDGYPAAPVHPATRLRPPDLVIQDELHLITGALGTTVGLFEVAIDVMTDWRTKDGRPVRPLLVASTATARNAFEQVRALYGRDVTIFPPQVLDAGNTFFSKELPVSEENPGRRYVGISTTGVRLTTAEIRVAEVLMAGGQLLLDRSGSVADPYMSLVGYFSATRELAGMARYMSDDIQTALAKGRPWSKLPRRTGTEFGSLHVAELTSRVASAEITATLDRMAMPFDPAFDSTAGKRSRRALREAKKPEPTREVNPYDVVLATSMLQVGVDVTRLGLMLVVGQPKNTAEYIQASSRVGRDADRPGLVLALGNWARPRDLAHFEQFRHYHETFYAQVEALSVTPFSVTSLERGLDGVLVSAARVLQAAKAGHGQGLSPEGGAGRIEAEQQFADELTKALVRRIERAGDEDAAERARLRLKNRLDQWGQRRKHLAEHRKSLVYERVVDDTRHDALMMGAENAKPGLETRDAPPFIVANSMREVQPEINLLVSPIKERLVYIAPVNAPQWVMPEEKKS
ncbi:DISARM system helicase DrmA [Streptomyces sp. NBC_01276]|uniref:DISARM system helicase DrmA n=1 Tax=Streptomyces sp. NBC_01276 TaxID=2903808 RepID=UPI00352EBDEF